MLYPIKTFLYDAGMQFVPEHKCTRVSLSSLEFAILSVSFASGIGKLPNFTVTIFQNGIGVYPSPDTRLQNYICYLVHRVSKHLQLFFCCCAGLMC